MGDDLRSFLSTIDLEEYAEAFDDQGYTYSSERSRNTLPGQSELVPITSRANNISAESIAAAKGSADDQIGRPPSRASPHPMAPRLMLARLGAHTA